VAVKTFTIGTTWSISIIELNQHLENIATLKHS
jgi:hypothetical protein